MGKDSWLNEKSWKPRKFSDFMVLSYTIVYVSAVLKPEWNNRFSFTFSYTSSSSDSDAKCKKTKQIVPSYIRVSIIILTIVTFVMVTYGT